VTPCLITYRLDGSGENHVIVAGISEAIRLIAEMWNPAFAMNVSLEIARCAIAGGKFLAVEVPAELIDNSVARGFLEIRPVVMGEWFGTMLGTDGKDF
jgi:hypothetical protein